MNNVIPIRLNQEDASALHSASFKNRDNVLKSKACGCFYCLKVFEHKDIVTWVDKGETALCPFCGIDAVLPDVTNQRTLFLMNRLYFDVDNDD